MGRHTNKYRLVYCRARAFAFMKMQVSPSGNSDAYFHFNIISRFIKTDANQWLLRQTGFLVCAKLG